MTIAQIDAQIAALKQEYQEHYGELMDMKIKLMEAQHEGKTGKAD